MYTLDRMVDKHVAKHFGRVKNKSLNINTGGFKQLLHHVSD